MKNLINKQSEKHIFDSNNYYYLDDYAKYNGYQGYNDPRFIDDFVLDKELIDNDLYISDWLAETKEYELNELLYCYVEEFKQYNIVCIANLETWNIKGQTKITPLEHIHDIFNYRGQFDLTDIFEYDNCIKFCISHHDGNDKYYIFFNNEQYNKDLYDDVENSIIEYLDYDYYKEHSHEYEQLINNLCEKYDTDYIKSCINNITQIL